VLPLNRSTEIDESRGDHELAVNRHLQLELHGRDLRVIGIDGDDNTVRSRLDVSA
jgi:hypothetical protein